MRFGALLLAPRFPAQSHAAVLDGTVAAAVAAEDAGFDDVWIAEHHFMSYGVCPSALTMAGYLLGATGRIAVGTAVSVLSTQHPVAMAEQAALLDHLSHGRFRLGIGRGGPWVELDVLGTGLARWEHGYPAALDRVLAALRGHSIGDDLELVPAPRARLPVIAAVTSDAGLQVAAARGLPMMLGMHADDADKAASVARYRQLAPGAEPGHISAHLAQVADTRAEAVAAVRETLPRWLGPGLAGYRRADGKPHVGRDPHEYTELLCRLHPVGSPDHCAEALLATARRTGIRHLILMVQASGEPVRDRETIARFGAEVLPRLRDQWPTPAGSPARANGTASATNS